MRTTRKKFRTAARFLFGYFAWFAVQLRSQDGGGFRAAKTSAACSGANTLALFGTNQIILTTAEKTGQ
jgi:hypothetical protein